MGRASFRLRLKVGTIRQYDIRPKGNIPIAFGVILAVANSSIIAKVLPQRRTLVTVGIVIGGLLASPLAHASEGGANKPPCIWEKDLVLDIDGHELTISQEAVKNGKVQESDGYFVRPDPRTLFLFVRTPEGQLYRTGLTVLEIGKGRDRCLAFFAGRMTLSSGTGF